MRTAREHKRKSGGRRRAVTALAAAALCAFAGILCLAGLEPPMDNADGAAPAAFFCHVSGNYAARQTDGKCAAYASAYVLRHLGEQADGEGIYPEIKRTLGFAAPRNVAALFQTRGYCAQAYHGSLNSLRQRLCAGVPIIAFVAIPNDTHYVVVVGYDADYLYLADSLAAEGAPYNRKLPIEEFERVWKTKTLLPDNIYIVINEK